MSEHVLPSHPIRALDFTRNVQEALDKVSARRRNFIDEEFNSLEDLDRELYSARGQRCSSAITRENVRKNRYMDILPGDATRVVLRTTAAGEGDYINANYIDGRALFGIDTRNYIVTQGPTEDTIKHFWTMMLEHRCPIILCLTRLEEGRMSKCDQYWPSADDGALLQMGDVVVKLESQSYADEGQDIVERRLTVRRKGRPDDAQEQEETHTLVMYHFEAWPDHGVPSQTDSFRHLLRLTNDSMAQQAKDGKSRPICVHCSAGVGRTGTFIAVDVVLEQLKHHQSQDTLGTMEIDLQNVVAVLKDKRSFMVQRRPQYAFAYRVLVQELAEHGL